MVLTSHQCCVQFVSRMDTKPIKALTAAIRVAGNQRKLAKALGYKNQSAIGNMMRRLRADSDAVVPAHICPAIEKFTKGAVKRSHLNPKVAW